MLACFTEEHLLCVQSNNRLFLLMYLFLNSPKK